MLELKFSFLVIQQEDRGGPDHECSLHPFSDPDCRPNVCLGSSLAGNPCSVFRRNHSTQYIAFPDYPWHRLCEETPGLYEAYSDLVPGEWTRYRVEVEGERARLCLHGNEQPTLLVNDLKLAGQGGAAALWTGPGTVAHFRNPSVMPE